MSTQGIVRLGVIGCGSMCRNHLNSVGGA
ncbi:MAG: hypothetical protein GW802_28375, partial [Armatimonadetes bacterium]|nr:hypothetical protein [Armatimonadota bacterium]